MKPDIFMDDFGRTEWGDSIYSAIGRVQLFVKLCGNSYEKNFPTQYKIEPGGKYTGAKLLD
jgi:hypothetical protein